jgi:glycine hydroxymethyltransferase
MRVAGTTSASPKSPQETEMNEHTTPASLRRFFTAPLAETDPELAAAISREMVRQNDGIELIASENIVSQAVLEAQGSVMTNKYAEGYPGRRYYGGCVEVDVAEVLAIERAKQLFGCSFANVQPHSGAQANQAVFLALIKPGDTILGMSLAAGGHLTHGAAPNLSGKWFHAVQYGVRESDGLIDYEELERLAHAEKPKMIIAGGSAYPREIDFARIRAVADAVGAYFMVDMAHVAGLVAAGVYPSPLPHAHVTTTTTHKTLRGPRGGMILSNDAEIGKKINSAVFPGLQGGPLMHVIAGKAAAFGEALRPDFRAYQRAVVDNARTLAATLIDCGVNIVTGGTDSHLMLVDLRPKKVTGKAAEASLERAHITANKNAIPFDPEKPAITSGIRLGTPAATTRGFGTAEFESVGRMIGRVLDGLAASNDGSNEAVEAEIGAQVKALCARFPLYGA